MSDAVGDYPVNLRLDGRRVLLVGAGNVAARKLGDLLASGAQVTVVAPLVREAVRAMADAAPDQVTVIERAFVDADLDGVWLATTTTDDPAVNAAVRAAGDARQVFVNSADDPANCSVTLPARVRQGDLLVAISTGGRAPAVASGLRRQLQDELGPEWATLVELIAGARDRLHAEGRSTEPVDWRPMLGSGTLEAIREGRLAEVKERLEACLSSSSD